MRTVTVISGPAEGASMEIERELVIGREGADLTIPDSEMSRRHAAVRPVEGGVEIEDLESLNGTRIDGHRLSAPRTISSTTNVLVGQTELRIDVEVAQATRISHPSGSLRPTDVTAPRKTARRDLGGTVQRRAGPPAAPVQPPPAPQEAPRAPEAPPAPAAPEGRPPAAAPPGAAAPARDRRAGRPRPPRGLLVGLIAATLVVAAIVALVIVANTGGSKSTHSVDSTLRVGVAGRSLTNMLLAGVQTGAPGGDGAATLDVEFRAGNPWAPSGSPAGANAQQLARAGWTCFPITAEGAGLIHCGPPGYLQRNAPDVPLVVFDESGSIFLGTEDLIRNNVFHGQKCPFEGGGPYHPTPRGYFACHEFPLGTAIAATSKSPAAGRFSAHLVQRTGDASTTSIVAGTATPTKDGGVSFTGRGHFTGGTGDFDGADGSYRLTGSINPQGIGQLILKGTVEY